METAVRYEYRVVEKVFVKDENRDRTVVGPAYDVVPGVDPQLVIDSLDACDMLQCEDEGSRWVVQRREVSEWEDT